MSSNDVLTFRLVAGIAVIRPPLKIDKSSLSIHDVHDIKREPAENLFLLVKKPRDDHAWQFPQGGLKNKGQEPISQGALRELAEECGHDLKVDLIDKVNPTCVYQYDFPPEFIKSKKKKKQYRGAKVHFVRAEWVSGKCRPDGKEIIDFAWLTAKEIPSFVSDDYLAGIKQLIY